MGWTYPYNRNSKAELALDLLQMGPTRKVLDHSMRGNTYYVLIEYADGSGRTLRGILVYLLQPDEQGRYGYKDMDETMEPYYWDCPLRLIDKADEIGPSPYPAANAWRKQVRDLQAKTSSHAKKVRELKRGDTITLVGAAIPHILILDVKPLIGEYENKIYRIPQRFVGERVEA